MRKNLRFTRHVYPNQGEWQMVMWKAGFLVQVSRWNGRDSTVNCCIVFRCTSLRSSTIPSYKHNFIHLVFIYSHFYHEYIKAFCVKPLFKKCLGTFIMYYTI